MELEAADATKAQFQRIRGPIDLMLLVHGPRTPRRSSICSGRLTEKESGWNLSWLTSVFSLPQVDLAASAKLTSYWRLFAANYLSPMQLGL